MVRKALRGLSGLILAAALLCGSCPWAAAAAEWETTILFTHDLHSHFLPLPDGEGGERGGYARLKTAIDREKEKYPDALLVDGGDPSAPLSAGRHEVALRGTLADLADVTADVALQPPVPVQSPKHPRRKHQALNQPHPVLGYLLWW